MLVSKDEIVSALGYDALFSELSSDPATVSWSEQLKNAVDATFDVEANGNLPRWIEGFHDLPELHVESVNLQHDAVTVTGNVSDQQRSNLRDALMQLHPWRKGPFRLFDLPIDTEWRSDWKWQRLIRHVDLTDKDILDVGCGNGYYGWRMLGAGAKRVVGLDPMMLYVMQAAALGRYFGDLPNYVLPGSDTSIPKDLNLFDTVFSMGVLYHRNSPMEHLQSLASALKRGGELVLETLVIEGDENQVLVPSGRYAQMRNVWFIPSPPALERWLERCGFTEIKTVDLTTTTPEEQRSTEWMNFDSLVNFLDPLDLSKTVEGYPAPIRAILVARKKSE